MVGGNINSRQYNDTTSTKIFVGGLAWETQRDTMRRYFEQIEGAQGTLRDMNVIFLKASIAAEAHARS